MAYARGRVRKPDEQARVHYNKLWNWCGNVIWRPRKRGCHSAMNELILIHAFSYEPPLPVRISCRYNPGASFLRVQSGHSKQKKLHPRTGSPSRYGNAHGNTGSSGCSDTNSAT